MLNVSAIKDRTYPYIERLLWFVFTGSRGGPNRLKIILHLKKNLLNSNQLANALGIDYKAVQHHIRVLEQNNLIIKSRRKHSTVYSISPIISSNLKVIDEIISKYNESNECSIIQ
jgi:predicted transcriptional regulator